MVRQRAAGTAPDHAERPGARRGGILAPDLDLGAITGPYRQPERSFERQVIQYAELMGWHVRKDRATNARRACRSCGAPVSIARNTAGWPDLVLIRRPRILFVELKAERGKLTDDQRACLEDLRACGQAAFCWRPSDWPVIERVLR